jgi:putative transposase
MAALNFSAREAGEGVGCEEPRASSREWFTQDEVAGLPGLPATRIGILKLSARQGWSSRARDARGGGREYHISNLPDRARAALLLRLQASSPVPIATTLSSEEKLWADLEAKPGRVKEEAARRVKVMTALDQLIADGVKKTSAYAAIAFEAEESVSTIRNWHRVIKGKPADRWAPLLAPKWAGGRGGRDYDQRIYAKFRDLYLDTSRPPASTCYNRVVRWAANENLKMPSYATLVRELKRREDPSVILLEREGKRALEASFPYLERSREGLYAMQLLNIDGHNLDLAVVWPDGEKVRATLLGIQDVYSSAIVGWKLVKSETAHGMSLAFLDVFDRLGVPQRILFDNTFAAASKRMTSGAPGRKRFRDQEGDPLGVLPMLGIQVTFVTPAHGQSKPIERAFRTIADQISKHPSFSGAYLGNNPMNKPSDYGERTITIEELLPVVEQEIIIYNTQLGRRTEVCAGKKSFQQVFDSSYTAHAGQITRLVDSQRRLLYLVAERVTVDRRDGCVKLFKNRYWSDELARLKGKQVVLRYHPTESLHQAVWAYRLDGTLIGEIPVYSKAGFVDAEAAQSHTRARRQFVNAKKDLAKAHRRMTAAEVAALIPAAARPALPIPSQGGVFRADFSLPLSEEQLGKFTKADRRDAERRTTSALQKVFGETTLTPKRRRA